MSSANYNSTRNTNEKQETLDNENNNVVEKMSNDSVKSLLREIFYLFTPNSITKFGIKFVLENALKKVKSIIHVFKNKVATESMPQQKKEPTRLSEYAFNNQQDIDIHKNRDMWGDAKHSIEMTKISTESHQPKIHPIESGNELQTQPLTNVETFEDILNKVVTLQVPQFVESGATVELVIFFNNSTDQELNDLRIDFSDLEYDFIIDKVLNVTRLKPGADLERRIRIIPKEQKGTFPVKIKIAGHGITIEKEYTIKVGGTEIY